MFIIKYMGTEAEIQLPLKRSFRFQHLFPNPEYQSYVEFKRVCNKATAELRRSKRAFEEKLNWQRALKRIVSLSLST